MKKLLFLVAGLISMAAQARIIRLQKNNDGGIYKPVHNAAPGDTILLEGRYQYINIENVFGEPGKEIVIINKGQVVISGYSAYCCIVIGKYFKLLGNGDPGLKYGIRFSGYGNTFTGFGLATSNSSNYEIAFCEFTKLQAGILQNVIAQKNLVDVYLHDNYFNELDNPQENGRSEAFYIGNTGAVSPGKFKNCRIENNILENLSGDGIQVCQGEFIIKSNRIVNWAKAKLEWQRNGILVGGSASAKVENNTLTGGHGVAFQFLGGGANTFKNNVIRNVDVSGLNTEDIVYIDARSPKFSIDFSNNQFINVKPNHRVIFNSSKDQNTAGSSFKNNIGVSKTQCLLNSKDKWKK
ncbi:MAG: right-handed parallel beta-helix repeat-containing protein [Flavisolibacter sp.]